MTAKDIGHCVGGSLGLEFGEDITVDVGLSGKKCGSSGAADTGKYLSVGLP